MTDKTKIEVDESLELQIDWWANDRQVLVNKLHNLYHEIVQQPKVNSDFNLMLEFHTSCYEFYKASVDIYTALADVLKVLETKDDQD